MWGVFVGVGLGILELYLLKKLVGFVTADRDRMVVSVLVTIGKLFLMLAVLFIMAKFVSLTAMIWCGGGIAGTMVVLTIISGARSIKHAKYSRKQGEGSI
ncbi:MAG: hypothetical protein ACOYJB_04105 [Christensenellaceae bacterium]|jgi:hypothetical protein